jgi:hypothetical protein
MLLALLASAFAAPLLGLVGSAVILGLGIQWFGWRVRAAHRAGEGYGEPVAAAASSAPEARGGPRFAVAILPIIVVVCLNFLLTEDVIRRWDSSYLAQPRFGATSLESVRGLWATILSLIAACGVVVLLRVRSLRKLNESLSAGVM